MKMYLSERKYTLNIVAKIYLMLQFVSTMIEILKLFASPFEQITERNSVKIVV